MGCRHKRAWPDTSISDFVCPAWLNENLHAAISKNDAFERLRQELDELLAAA